MIPLDGDALTINCPRGKPRPDQRTDQSEDAPQGPAGLQFLVPTSNRTATISRSEEKEWFEVPYRRVS
jgi:hypothetical protein